MTKLRGPDFRLLVASTGLSTLGDEMALIALAIKVDDLTRSGGAVAALLLAGLLPMVLFAPVAGVLVDRFETRRTLAVASAAQAALAVALAFASSLPEILVLAFLLGAGASVASPAVFALVPVAAGEERLTEANAYVDTARYAGGIAGPILAGTLSAGLDTRVAMLVDAGTFLAIAGAASAMRVRRLPSVEPGERLRGQARRGFGFIARDRVLLVTFAVFSAVILFAAMDNVAEVFFAREDLGAARWGYGLLASGWMLGMVVGAVGLARSLPEHRLIPALMVAAAAGGAAVALAAMVPVLGVAVAMFVVGGIANGVESVSMRSLIAHRAPEQLRGRVFAAYSGLATSMQIGATAAAGVTVGVLGARTALFIGGAGSAVAGLGGLAWFLTMPRTSGDHVPPELTAAFEHRPA